MTGAGLFRIAFRHVALLAAAVLIPGCSLVESKHDSFVSLHARVQEALAADSDCGPVRTNEFNGRRLFEVVPRRDRLNITVTEKPFFTQKEWDGRYARGTNQMHKFLEMTMAKTNGATGGALDAERKGLINGTTNLFGLAELPDWRYEDIGVGVNIQELDEANPNAEKDDADARRRCAKIIQFLKPYHRGAS